MSSSLLIGTVSDFWRNHFKDYEAVEALVGGIFSSSADSYSLLSSAAVSRSIDSAVLHRRSKHKLMPIARHNLLLKQGTDSGGTTRLYYIIEVPSQLLTMSSIVSNSGPEPSSRLILNEDFSIHSGSDFEFKSKFMASPDGGSWIEENSKYLMFIANPLDTAGAQKGTILVQDYYRLDVASSDSSWVDTFTVGKEVRLSNGTYSRVLAVLEGSKIILEPSAPATIETSSISDLDGAVNNLPVVPVLFTVESKTCYLLANDYTEDTEYLYNHFGFRYSPTPSKSTEHYRKILKAKALLSTAPPTKETLLSACNLFLGLPVFEAGTLVGEQLISSESQSPSGKVKVRTSLADYIVESGLTIRSDVSNSLFTIDGVNQANRQDLEFSKLEPLCSDIEVFSNTDSDWWYDQDLLYTLPINIAPGLSQEIDREIIEGTHDNIVGSPNPGVIPEQRIGDYHFKVGDNTRSVLATSLTEDFLKWKLVGIKFSDAVKNLDTRFSVGEDMLLSIQQSLPVGTLLLHNLG